MEPHLGNRICGTFVLWGANSSIQAEAHSLFECFKKTHGAKCASSFELRLNMFAFVNKARNFETKKGVKS